MQISLPPIGSVAGRQVEIPTKPAVFVVTLTLMGVATHVFPAVADIIGALAVFVGHGIGGQIALRQAKKMEGRERLVWRLIGYGLTSAASGVLLIFILGAFGVDLPAFGPIDIFFVGGYLGILAGAAALPNAFAGRRDLARTLIDGIVGAISIGTLAWVLVVGDLVNYFRTASSWALWLGSAYPFLDILTIIVFVTLLSRRSHYRMDKRLSFILLGAGFQVVADLTFLTSGVDSSFSATNPIYPLFIAASFCFAAGAYFADATPKPREYAERTIHYLATAAPYGVAIALTGVTLVSLPYAGFDSAAQLLTAATIIVGTLVIVRQALAIHDNRTHVDQKRTDLAQSISHELRTPLTAVVGFLDLMNDAESDLTDEERAELVAITHREANRMSRIVADVILLTRYDPKDLDLVEVPTVIDELIHETLHTMDTKGVRVEVDANASLVARVDRGRIQQILVNLIENALRYGNGQVTLVAASKGADLVIQVHDNGPGVPKHDQNIVWQRFERGANRFNAAIPGSGVGLAVVAAVAAAHGGDARYRDSTLLGGACFEVQLPDRCLAPASSPVRTATLLTA